MPKAHLHYSWLQRLTRLIGTTAFCAVLVLFSLGASCQRDTEEPGPITKKRDTTPEKTVSNDLLTELPTEQAEPVVRVLLRSIVYDDPPELILSGEGWIGGTPDRKNDFKVTGDKPFNYPAIMPTYVQQGLSIHAPEPDRTFSLGGKNYRGSLLIRAGESGKYEYINRVGMEDYCAGSVGWEAIPSWEPEALKAQAIAIRTYTLHALLATRSASNARGWDVDDTTRYLRYGGIGPDGQGNNRETPAVRDAVDSTAGMVITFQGRLLKAFFHSTSGGHTNASRRAFGGGTIPPLAGADMGSYGEGSTLHRWTRDKARSDVEAALASADKSVGTLKAITPVDPVHGWAKDLRITGSDTEIVMPAGAFRSMLGTGTQGLPSTNFTASFEGDRVIFNGRGFGHGVGLDQYASQGMAKAGMTHAQILAAMYPGTDKADLW